MTSQSQMNGIAAVHLVATELSLRGYPVAVTARNTEGVDLFASSLKTGKAFAIQVKSNRLGSRSRSSNWGLGRKRPITAQNYIYAFVDMHDNSHHEFFIVPSSVVKARCSRTPKGEYYFKRSIADPYRDGWKIFR